MGFNLNFLKTGIKDVENAGGKALNFLSNPVNVAAPAVPITRAIVKQVTGKTLPDPGPVIRNAVVSAGRSVARVLPTIATSAEQLGSKRATGAVSSTLDDLQKLDYNARIQAIQSNPGLQLVLKGKGLNINDPSDTELSKARQTVTNVKPVTYTPGSTVEKLALGKEPVQSYQQRTEGNKQVLEGSRFRSAATPLAFLAGGLTVGGDVTGLSVGENALGKEAIDKLVQATTESGVKKVLGKDVAPDVVRAITQTKDPHVIENLLKGGNKIPKVAEPVIPPAPPAEVLAHIANPAAVGQDALPAAKGLAEATVPPVENNPVKNVVDALRGQPTAPGQSSVTGIEKLQQQQKELYSAERSARLAQSKTAAEGATGRDATFAQLGALKGQLPKVDAAALVEHLKTKVSPEDVNGILDTIRTHPNLSGYEPITAQNAIVKLFDEGKLPTPSEFKILEKVSPELSDTLKTTAIDSMDNWQKIKNFGTQVLGMPKALMASLDFSGGGRQGAVLGSRFPKEFAASQVESVKYFGSDQAFKDGMAEIAGRENAPIYAKMKLALDIPGTGAHEEQYVSQLGERIPGLGRGVAASDRAYSGGLSRLRADSADHILLNLKDAGIDPSTLSDKALQDLGRYINTASGRGNLGAFEKHAQSLGEALFSPRLWKSRLDMLNPVYYAKLDPVARKYALQSAGSFAAIAGTVLGLATLAGAKVETDARSSDFLKIKVGDTRYDILGGFQQNLVFAWRELSGEKKSSVTGAVSKLDSGGPLSANRLSILSDLIQNKENPVISAAQTQIKGSDKAGNKLTPSARAAAVGNLFVPLNIQDTYKTSQDTGSIPKGLLKATVPGTVGIGVGTYGVKDIQPSGKQKQYLDKLQKSGAPQAQIDASKSLFQYIKSAPSRDNASTDIKKALTNSDGTFNQNGVKQAVQLAKDYNKKYQSNFDDWRKKYPQYKTDKNLVKEYNSNLITNASIDSYITTIKKASSPNANL